MDDKNEGKKDNDKDDANEVVHQEEID